MPKPTSTRHATELALLHALALHDDLICRQAAHLCGVGISTLRRTAMRLEHLGLVTHIATADGKAPHESRQPRLTHHFTLAGNDLIALLDLTSPTTPTYRLLTIRAQACGVGSLPYNHTLSPADNLAMLAYRAAVLRTALDSTSLRPLHITLLLPDPKTIGRYAHPFADLLTHPGRYTACLAPLSTENAPLPPLLIPESDALAAAIDTLPVASDTQSLLYLRTTPTPRADLFLRPAPGAPLASHPCGAPLTDTLTRSLSDPTTSAPLDRYLTNLTAFCRPDTILAELPRTDIPATVSALSHLSPAIRHHIIPREPHAPSLSERGTHLLTLRNLWAHHLP